MKIFKNTCYISFPAILISSFLIFCLNDTNSKLLNWCISANVTFIFAFISSLIGYAIEKREIRRKISDSIHNIHKNLIGYIQETGNKNKLNHLNMAIDAFNDYDYLLDSYSVFFFQKKEFKKILEPRLYLQDILIFINTDLFLANKYSTNKDKTDFNRCIKNIDEVLLKSFVYNKRGDSVHIILNDFQLYTDVFRYGAIKKYNFSTYPDYKRSLNVLIKDENEDLKNFMYELYFNFCKQHDDNGRFCCEFRGRENSEVKRFLEELQKKNYIEWFEDMNEKLLKNGMPSIIINNQSPFYDIQFYEKFFKYFEVLEDIDVLNNNKNFQLKET